MLRNNHRGAGIAAPLGPTANQWNDTRWHTGQIRSTATYRAARWHIRTLTNYLGTGTPTADVTTPDLRLWLECLAADGIQPRSRNTITSTIRGYFTWAHDENLIDVNPMARIRNVRPPHRAVRPVPPDHVTLILDHAPLRTQVIVVLLAQIGFRRGEVASIRWENYDPSTGVLLIEQAKGCKDRTVVLEREPAEALEVWRAHQATTRPAVAGPVTVGPVFPGHTAGEPISAGSVHRIVVEASHAVGLHYTPHQYRHTCGTQWTRAGVPTATLARQLGHVDVSTTGIYTGVDVEGLRPHVAPTRYKRGNWYTAPGPSTVSM